MPDMPTAPVPASVPTPAAPPADLKATLTPPAAPSTDVKAPAADSKAPDMTKAEKAVIQKIKVGDMEFDETTLKGLIEKAKGADKKFLEAAKARKEAIKFFKLAKENPEELLSKSGQDPMKWAYERVAKDVQDKLRDPREVELEKAKAELEQFHKEKAEAKSRAEQERVAKETQAFKAKFEAEIIDALEATPSLPKNGFTVAKIAQYISTVRNKTGVLLSPKEVVNVIEKDVRAEVQGILRGADAEKVIGLLGDEMMAAIRKYDLAKLKDPLQNGQGTVADPTQPKSSEKKRWKNSHQYWKSMDEEFKREKGLL